MAENQNQNKEFENMINEICKNIFPNMNLNEEQMKLFTEKFIKKDDGEEEESNDNNDEEDEDDSEEDSSNDDNDSNDDDDNSDENNSTDDSDGDDESTDEDIIFDEDDDDENFDITNLNLSCNMCGEKIDESSNYVITPCTHFLHTACIKNKILNDNNKQKDLDAILDKAMDEFLNNEKCEDCDVCKSLF